MLNTKLEQKIHWEKYAKERLLGKTVKANSLLNQEELDALGWYSNHAMAIEFTDGSTIFPSSDDEGNDAGFFSFRANFKGGYKLAGAKVVKVEYLNDLNMKTLGWFKRPLTITLGLLGGGTVWMIAQTDPEGNDGGAIFGGAIFGGSEKEEWTFPVIS